MPERIPGDREKCRACGNVPEAVQACVFRTPKVPYIIDRSLHWQFGAQACPLMRYWLNGGRRTMSHENLKKSVISGRRKLN